MEIQKIYDTLPKTYQRALIKLAKTMKSQSDKGLEKYGFSMDDNDNKDPEYWENHLREEIADAMVYMQKLVEVMQSTQHRSGSQSGTMNLIKKNKSKPFTQSGTMNLLKQSINQKQNT